MGFPKKLGKMLPIRDDPILCLSHSVLKCDGNQWPVNYFIMKKSSSSNTDFHNCSYRSIKLNPILLKGIWPVFHGRMQAVF